MVVAPATEMLPVPARGRRFGATSRVRLGDVDPQGRMRLDAIARHLQDVASDDASDSGLDASFGWVVRRTLIDIGRAPELGESLQLTTFCTATGRAWAERRTSIVGGGGASVEAVSLWVQVDLTTGRPTALGEQFHDRYGEAAGGRRVSTRLALPAPPPSAEAQAWTVRAVDLDVFGHVNNASHWPVLEEVLAGPLFDRTGVAEMEHLVPVDIGSLVELRFARTAASTDAWLVAGDRVHTAARWRPRASAHGFEHEDGHGAT